MLVLANTVCSVLFTRCNLSHRQAVHHKTLPNKFEGQLTHNDNSAQQIYRREIQGRKPFLRNQVKYTSSTTYTVFCSIHSLFEVSLGEQPNSEIALCGLVDWI